MHELNCFTVALGAVGSSRVFLGVSGRAQVQPLALISVSLLSARVLNGFPKIKLNLIDFRFGLCEGFKISPYNCIFMIIDFILINETPMFITI